MRIFVRESIRLSCKQSYFAARAVGANPLFMRLSLLIFCLLPSLLRAQTVSCHGQINLGLPSSCEATVTPQMLLVDDSVDDTNLVVDVDGTGSDLIDGSYLGQSVPVQLTNILTGQSCWTFILVEDKTAPEILCGADTVVSCLVNPLPVSEGGDFPDPVVLECTGISSLTYTDQITDGDCGDPFLRRIVRTYAATDVMGLSSTCSQTIDFTPVPLDSLACPPDVTVECAALQLPDTGPDATGYPTLTENGVTYELTPELAAQCMLLVSLSEFSSDKCGIGEKIVRTWTILDMCADPNDPNQVFTCTQFVNVADNEAPLITAPADLTVAASSTHCFAIFDLPPATVADCSDVSVLIETPAGPVVGNGGTIPSPGLDVGTYTITYVATDECGNVATADITVTIEDQTPPVLVCETDLQVVLDNFGNATLTANDVPVAVTDNCCTDFTKTIQRMEDACDDPANLTPGASVSFCCADLMDTIQLVVRVVDCAGNENVCMVPVTVTDTGGGLVCPPDVTLDCGADFTNAVLTGTVVTDGTTPGSLDGFVASSCADFDVSFEDSLDLNVCGTGMIFRTYRAVSGSLELVCTQKITLEAPNPLDCDEVQFPADVDLMNCQFDTSIVATGMPVLPDLDCAQLTVEMDQTFLQPGTDGACFDLVRTWTVRDECEPLATGSVCTDEQRIRLFDDTAPEISACVNRAFCTDQLNCEAETNLTVAVTDDCLPADQLTLTWTVDLFDDGTTDDSGTGQNVDVVYPVGDHRIFYTVTDLCGNAASCDFRFFVEDCGKPQLVCPVGQSFTLNPDGTRTLDIGSLDFFGTTDNCTPAEDLIFSFASDPTVQTRTFTCADLGTVPVEIFVTDAAGSQSFCNAALTFTDPANACASTSLLVGQVQGTAGQGLSQTPILLDNAPVATTDVFGDFHLFNLEPETTYELRPVRPDDLRNGVSTLDLIRLQKHLLGLEPFTSPYEYLAADVNNSGSVTALDLTELRRVILHIHDAMPNNEPWRFIDATYEFPDPTNPWLEPFPESCFSVGNSDLPVNFVAVKVGDLNGSAVY